MRSKKRTVYDFKINSGYGPFVLLLLVTTGWETDWSSNHLKFISHFSLTLKTTPAHDRRRSMKVHVDFNVSQLSEHAEKFEVFPHRWSAAGKSVKEIEKMANIKISDVELMSSCHHTALHTLGNKQTRTQWKIFFNIRWKSLKRISPTTAARWNCSRVNCSREMWDEMMIKLWDRVSFTVVF